MVDNIKKKMPTHCVVMVTYNHEQYIRTALDSVFDNEILPDKVMLFDDCSTDSTWKIICEYQAKYSSILESHRNEKNLGLFQNINQAYKAAVNSDYDIITDLAGDDYLKKGVFEELNRVIEENNVDFKKEKFIIITNTEELYPDGTVKLFDNYKLRNEKDLIYYRLIEKLSYREVGLSRNVLKNIELYRSDLGVLADLLVCLNYETNCDKFYFSPFISAGYRVGVGTVSKNTKNELRKSIYDVDKIILSKYRLSRKSKSYLKHNMKKIKYELERDKFDNNVRKNFPIIHYLKFYGIIKTLRNVIKKINLKWRTQR